MNKIISFLSIAFILVAILSCNTSSEKETPAVMQVNESTHDASNYSLNDSLSFMKIITEKDDVFDIKFVVGNFKVKENRLISGKTFLDFKSVDPEAQPINKAFIAEEYMNVKYFPQAILNIIRVSEYTERNSLFGFRPTHKFTAFLVLKSISKQIEIPVKIKFDNDVLKIHSSENDFVGSNWNIGSKKNIMLEKAKYKINIIAKRK